MKKQLLALGLVAFIGGFVNLAASNTVHYKCSGSDVKVAFPNDKDVIMSYDGELILLSTIKTPKGNRYVGEGWQLWKNDKKISLAVITEDEAVNGKVSTSKPLKCKLVKNRLSKKK